MKIMLGVPGNGMLCESAAQASWLCSLHHEVDRTPSCGSGPNFNRCWTAALNGGAMGKYQRFAMMHTDLQILEIEEGKRWLDILSEEMDNCGAHFISVPVAIKDHRMLTSCGIGNPACRWNPWRRFTTKELDQFPRIFDASMLGYHDKFIIHSGALCLWDLTWPGWYKPDEEGRCKAIYNFTEEIRLVGDTWICSQDSEDWAYSHALWKMQAKTFVTRRIAINHHGGLSYGNQGDWGTYKNGDEDTKSQWAPDTIPTALSAGEQKNSPEAKHQPLAESA